MTERRDALILPAGVATANSQATVPNQHPYQVTVVEGVTAQMFARAPQREILHVRDAADIDKALGEEGNEHWCPFCMNFMSTNVFKKHLISCVKAYAPGWERQRDREPVSHYRGRLFGPRPRTN